MEMTLIWKCFLNVQEDRRKDQTRRRHVHECTDDQKKNIDDKENDITVITDAQHGFRYCRRNTGKCHNTHRASRQTCKDTGCTAVYYKVDFVKYAHESASFVPSLTSVSYTHLDVYKRQD